MPELPEVETIRADLAGALNGARIVTVEASGARSLRRHAHPGQFTEALPGRHLGVVGRRGKYLTFALDGQAMVVVHLGMSGQLLLGEAGVPERRHTHIRWALEDGRVLRFVDPRTFGQMWLSTPDRDGCPPELTHLGPDALDPAALSLARLATRSARLKPLLMDQRFVAGIGNLYTDEILWGAQLRHDRVARTLDRKEVGRLRRAARTILLAAVRHRGSSLSDQQFRDLFDRIGSYQAHHRVYAREGAGCQRCGESIVRAVAYGRSTFFCPRCQA